MLFWQNQLQINFALWCAASGYGGDFNNHLQATRLIAAVFRFHVYYQTTRLLKEMSIALPKDKNGNAIDSNFDRNAHERLCRAFSVDAHSDWRQTESDNQGLGTICNYWTNAGYHPLGKGTVYDSKSY